MHLLSSILGLRIKLYLDSSAKVRDLVQEKCILLPLIGTHVKGDFIKESVE